MGAWDTASLTGDTFQLDVHASGRANFENAMKIAFSEKVKSKAKFYLKHPEAGLILFWHDPKLPDSQELPNEMNVDAAIDFVWQWLNSFDSQSIVAYAGKQPDLDGNVLLGGFRAYNETWGHVLSYHTAIVAVKPEYILQSK